MFKVFSFFKVYEMDHIEKVFEITANDLHNAKRAIIEKGCDYDIIAINGVFEF